MRRVSPKQARSRKQRWGPQVGSGDDRTPMGVHEGLSCISCHDGHNENARASCKTCHPADVPLRDRRGEDGHHLPDCRKRAQHPLGQVHGLSPARHTPAEAVHGGKIQTANHPRHERLKSANRKIQSPHLRSPAAQSPGAAVEITCPTQKIIDLRQAAVESSWRQLWMNDHFRGRHRTHPASLGSCPMNPRPHTLHLAPNFEFPGKPSKEILSQTAPPAACAPIVRLFAQWVRIRKARPYIL